jgi:hypothetical protein
MITQTIKGWLQKAFAWWPWKQSPPIEYPHVASGVSSNSAPEIPRWTSLEGPVPQTGATPRRFTVENRAERRVQPLSEVPYSPPFVPPTSLSPVGAESTETVEDVRQHAPTPQQRLEFLRYLVQRGILNEDMENDSSHHFD